MVAVSAQAASADAKRHPCASRPSALVDRLEARTACWINRVRARRHLRPFRVNHRLGRAAAGHASDMVRHCYFAHTSLAGATIADRVRRAGYLSGSRSWMAGEAIAWMSRRRHPARTVVRMWMHSPPHRELLVSPRLRELGVGIVRGVPACHGGGFTFVADRGRRWGR
jgi:uncharacterized protein YkwD